MSGSRIASVSGHSVSLRGDCLVHVNNYTVYIRTQRKRKSEVNQQKIWIPEKKSKVGTKTGATRSKKFVKTE